jgi:hypothetical protein
LLEVSAFAAKGDCAVGDEISADAGRVCVVGRGLRCVGAGNLNLVGFLSDAVGTEDAIEVGDLDIGEVKSLEEFDLAWVTAVHLAEEGAEDVAFGDLGGGGIRREEVTGLEGEFEFRLIDGLIGEEEEWAEAVASKFAGCVGDAVIGEDVAGEDWGEFGDAGVEFPAADGEAVWGTFNCEDDEFFGGSFGP